MAVSMRVSQEDNLSDIFVPQLPADEWFFYTWITALVVVFVMVLLSLFVRHYFNPFRVIARQLDTGRITPREAAHQCAYSMKQTRLTHLNKTAIQNELDILRFQKTPPRSSQIKDLIRRIINGH